MGHLLPVQRLTGASPRWFPLWNLDLKPKIFSISRTHVHICLHLVGGGYILVSGETSNM